MNSPNASNLVTSRTRRRSYGRAYFLLATLSALLTCGCGGRPLTLDGIGIRRGERDELDPAERVEAGSRTHLAARAKTDRSLAWVVATWTVWEERAVPRVVQTKMFNTSGPTEVFTHLDPSTVSGGWPAGSITCEFRASGGEFATGRLRVVAQ
jgi:hypothetical protein